MPTTLSILTLQYLHTGKNLESVCTRYITVFTIMAHKGTFHKAQSFYNTPQSTHRGTLKNFLKFSTHYSINHIQCSFEKIKVSTRRKFEKVYRSLYTQRKIQENQSLPYKEFSWKKNFKHIRRLQRWCFQADKVVLSPTDFW